MRRLPFWQLPTVVTYLYGACGPAVAPATTPRQDLRSADQIIAGIASRSQRQDCELQDYSVTRRYSLRNRHLDGEASMTVLLKYQVGRGKQFSVLRSAGPGVAQRALLSLVNEEKSNEQNSAWNAVNSANYRFTLLDEETHGGRLSYHFKIVPRQNSKMLVDGELWVDARDLAVLEMKGHPAKSLSFWIGRPLIDQHYAPVNGFWMPSGNKTDMQVRLIGDTELNIEYWDYKFNLPALASKAP